MAKMYVTRHEDDRPEDERIMGLFRSIENAHFTANQQEVLANILRYVTGHTTTDVEPKEEMHEYSTRNRVAPPLTTGTTGRVSREAHGPYTRGRVARETDDVETTSEDMGYPYHNQAEIEPTYYTNEDVKPRDRLDPTFPTKEDVNTNDNDAIER